MYSRLLSAAVLLVLPTAASASCPASMDLTTRLNCLNRSLNAAATTIASLETANAALQNENAALEARLDDVTTTLETIGAIDVGDLFTYLSVDTATHSVVFSGANVYVQSGSGATDGAVNGLGNLIVGYDEDAFDLGYATSDRSGSHNLVVGMGHSYSSFGGFVAGLMNTVSGPEASVVGGESNTARGDHSAVVGGSANIASGWDSAVLGGGGNEAAGTLGSVSGGYANVASGYVSSVLGGLFNTASGETGAAVSGGVYNEAGGYLSSILGGYAGVASQDYETIPAPGVADLLEYLTVDTATNSVIFSGANVYVQSGSGATDGAVNGLGNLIVGYNEDSYGFPSRTGSHNLVVGIGNSYTSFGGLVAGWLNTVSGPWASVTGGSGNNASGDASSVVSGVGNTAGGSDTAILGGFSNFTTNAYSSVAGGSGNTASGLASSVLGGVINTASTSESVVAGGGGNVAGGLYSAILGGHGESTTEDYETFPE